MSSTMSNSSPMIVSSQFVLEREQGMGVAQGGSAPALLANQFTAWRERDASREVVHLQRVCQERVRGEHHDDPAFQERKTKAPGVANSWRSDTMFRSGSDGTIVVTFLSKSGSKKRKWRSQLLVRWGNGMLRNLSPAEDQGNRYLN